MGEGRQRGQLGFDGLQPMLGSSFINRITDRKEFPALRIGRDTWSRHEVATKLGIVHTGACGILSTICKKLAVTSTKDLYDQTSPYTLAEHRMGVTTLYCIFAAFRDKGLSVDDWYLKGSETQAIVTFLTLKHRELEAERRTKEGEKHRKRRARAVEHEAHVKRFRKAG